MLFKFSMLFVGSLSVDHLLQFVSSHMVSSYFLSCDVLIYSLVYVLTIGFIA